MQMLKNFIDSYERFYPKRLKEKQEHNEIQQNKIKLKRIFLNSNVFCW